MGESGRPALKLVGLLALFVGLTGLGLWWAAPDARMLRGALAHFVGLGLRTHLLLAALAVALIGAEMIRLVVFARAIGERVGFHAALDATIANNFFSWITPGSALGEPASTYMLARHGISWDAAVLISFAKFATSFVVILGAGCALLLLGLGPRITPLVLLPLAVAIALGALMMLTLILGAFAPEPSRSAVARVAGWLQDRLGPRAARAASAVAGVIDRSIERLARFRSAGAPGSMAMLASHVLYYGAFVAVLAVLAGAFGVTSQVDLIPVAIIYQGFLYLAPTPGGAGLGEAAADVFFGDLLPGGAAFAVVVLYRALTFYFHVAVGLVYLPIVGALRAILSQSR